MSPSTLLRYITPSCKHNVCNSNFCELKSKRLNVSITYESLVLEMGNEKIQFENCGV